MTVKENWTLRFLAVVFLGFVIGNLLFLDYVILKDRIPETSKTASINSSDADETEYCDKEDCVTQIYSAITDATQAAEQVDQAFYAQEVASQEGGEYVVSFGSGINTTNSWTNVPGAAAYIDQSLYPNITNVTFEAGVFIPTGNQTAYVRLFNQTVQHPVWFSDVSLSGGAAQLLVSQPITLDPGNNLYQVQMMSSLGYQTNLANASVRIQTN